MKEKIIKVINEVFEIDNANEQTSQKNCEQWDSLRHLNLILSLEEEFHTSFEPEEIAMMKDYSSVETMIKKKIG